jgi:hypothetical protein
MQTQPIIPNTTVKFFTTLLGSSVIVLVTGLWLLQAVHFRVQTEEVIYGYLTSITFFFISFFSVRYAAAKPMKGFMLLILGGMFLRFILIGAVVFVCMRYFEINIKTYLVTFVIFYLIFQAFEIHLINVNLPKRIKWLPDSNKTS